MRATVRFTHCSTGGAALLLVAVLGACTAEDGPEDAEAGPTTASESVDAEDTPTGAAVPGDIAAFCAATLDLEASFSVGLLAADGIPDPEERAAALEEWNTTTRRQVDDVEASAPGEVSDDVGTMSRFISDFLTFGELSDFGDPEYQRAEDVVDEYRLAACGYPQIKATGVEFAFQGLPVTVPAGVVAIRVANEGDDLHEVVIARVDDGVSMSFDELLALPGDQTSLMTTTVGRLFPLAPGAAETTFVRMEPGRYGVSCHLTQGTTQVSAGSGPPHHVLGMVAEFTVE